MTVVEISLGAALSVALLALGLLARYALAQRRRARQGLMAQVQAQAVALGERQAREQLAADVMARLTADFVMPLRTLLGEHAAAMVSLKTEVNHAFTALGQRIAEVGEQAKDMQIITRQLRETTVAIDLPPPTRVAATLPPGPAQVAAGLGERPRRPATSPPHPRPVPTHRPATLPPAHVPPRPRTWDDASAWDQREERPSDADGERTRVGARPSPEALAAAAPPVRPIAKTLVSMRAVAPTEDTGGGS